MIVRTLQEAKPITLFGCEDARILVDFSDGVGHVLVDMKIPPKSSIPLSQSNIAGYGAHAYYCISGSGQVQVGDEQHKLQAGSLVATGELENVTLKSESMLHLAYVYGQECNINSTIVRSLEDIRGTQREIYWGNGYSKRLLIQEDGLGFAFCITTGNSHTDSLIQYRNHFESCYYLSGTGEYEWDSGSHPIKTGDNWGTVFIMNNNDTHHMRIRDESVCLSIFTPPIEGHECHDFDRNVASSY